MAQAFECDLCHEVKRGRSYAGFYQIQNDDGTIIEVTVRGRDRTTESPDGDLCFACFRQTLANFVAQMPEDEEAERAWRFSRRPAF